MPGAHRGAADRQLGEAGQRRAQALGAVAALAGPAAGLLAEGDRHGVHEVGAARLDDVLPVLRLAVEHRAEVVQRGHRVADDRLGGGEVDRRREDVVGALRGVDVVVRVHLVAGRAGGQRRDDLVGVHVRAGARAGLEHVDRELVVVRAGRDLVRGGGHGVGEVGVEHAEVLVDARTRTLDQAERADLRGLDGASGDREVLHGPLGLRGPQRRGRHPDLAHGVVLDPVLLLLRHGAQSFTGVRRPPARCHPARGSRRSASRRSARGGCSRASAPRGCPCGTRSPARRTPSTACRRRRGC